MFGSIVNQLGLDFRTFVWPRRPLHMHNQTMMSHNVVTEIKIIVTCNKIHLTFTFCGEMLSIITYCAGCVQVTYEPIQYVHLNPFPVW
jgi:hypothetical protein